MPASWPTAASPAGTPAAAGWWIGCPATGPTRNDLLLALLALAEAQGVAAHADLGAGAQGRRPVDAPAVQERAARGPHSSELPIPSDYTHFLPGRGIVTPCV